MSVMKREEWLVIFAPEIKLDIKFTPNTPFNDDIESVLGVRALD